MRERPALPPGWRRGTPPHQPPGTAALHYIRDDVLREDGGVLPRGIGQRFRHRILLQGVEFVCEWIAGAARPRGGEAVVGDPAEEKRAGRFELGVLEGRDLVVPVRERPFVRRLGDTVESDELRNDQLHELSFSSSTNLVRLRVRSLE